MRIDRWGQYSSDDNEFDPVAQRVRIASQYTSDSPTTTQGSYDWMAPQHPYGHMPQRRGTVPMAQPAAGAGQAVVTRQQRNKQRANDFQAAWDQSEARVERLRRMSTGEQPWTGSPDDYNSVVSPPGDEGISAVVSKPPSASWRFPDTGAGVPRRGGDGDDFSGGPAQKVPTGVGGDW